VDGYSFTEGKNAQLALLAQTLLSPDLGEEERRAACTLFDDDEANIAKAAKAGYRSCLVPEGGFDRSFCASQLLRAGALDEAEQRVLSAGAA